MVCVQAPQRWPERVGSWTQPRLVMPEDGVGAAAAAETPGGSNVMSEVDLSHGAYECTDCMTVGVSYSKTVTHASHLRGYVQARSWGLQILHFATPPR